MPDYSTWSILMLRAELKRRGMRLTGRKADLIERLRALDSMADKSYGIPSMPPPPSLDIPEWPVTSIFKTITSETAPSLPNVSREQLSSYVILRQAQDRLPTADNSAMKKGDLLSKECVLGLSHTQINDQQFFSSTVHAAMKKNTTYAVRFMISNIGEIVFSSCECPAGAGPHCSCKHLCAAILILINLKNTGKLGIKMTCTETLQEFHKPKKSHAGSPIKSQALGGLTEYDEDPRPKKFKELPEENRLSRLANATVNFSHLSGANPSCRYMFPRANLQAAVSDHCYLDKPYTAY